jgi:signal transduction histidine kinase
LLGGVCAGLAEYLGRDALTVRIVTAAAVAVAGIGVLAYVLAWTIIRAAPGSERASRSRRDWLRAALLALAVLGALVGVRVAGLAIGDWPIWGLALGLWGLALLWRRDAYPASRGAEPTRPTLRSLVRRSGSIEAPRALVGLVLVAAGAAALLHSFGVQHNVGKAVGSVLIIGLVLPLVVAPWFLRLGRSLASERAARIREQERAGLAAHLHDSVLQTLALVQAAREAMTNAAKFAGEERIDLYAELTPDRAEVFVRDRGPGFDQTAIAADRRGVRDSVLGRMERQGGQACIRSAPDEGTEVELRVGASSGRVSPAA